MFRNSTNPLRPRDEIPTPVERQRHSSLGKRQLAKKSEISIELDHIPCPFLNSRIYGADVDLAARAVRLTSVSRRGILRDAFTHVEGGAFSQFGEPCDWPSWKWDGRDISGAGSSRRGSGLNGL